MVQPFTVASIQFNPILNEREGNINALMAAIAEAAESGAKLIVTPEMATTGYHYTDRKAIEPFVDTIPGHTTNRFLEVCRKHQVYLVVGLPEIDPVTALYYNSAALVGPEGYIGKYRKVHLWETEAHWAAWGDLGVPVFDTPLGKIAINICMDSIFFESARLAALNGADILAFPTNSTAQSISMLQARAETNGLYIISANRTNTEMDYHMIGASAIWSPDGEKLAEAQYLPAPRDDIEEPTFLYAEIDPLRYNNEAKNRLKERRPELYKELMLHISPWNYSLSRERKTITVAAIQYEPVRGDKAANLEKIHRGLENAAKGAAFHSKRLHFAVFPELSATGPVSDYLPQQRIELAESLDGATTQFMKKLAIEYEVTLLYGLMERENESLYNSAVLINSEGQVEEVYRQAHTHPHDRHWAVPGNRLGVIDTKALGRIGIMIGYDALFPETAGIMAVNRANLIAIPSSWRGEFGKPIAINRHISANSYPHGAVAFWDAIAIGAQAYTVVANYTGTEKRFLGRSGLYALDPLYGLDQTVVASEHEEEAVLAELVTAQPDWWFNQEKLIASRRTHLYKKLVYSPVDNFLIT